MSGYIGPAPVPQATQTREAFTATSGQTTFNTGGYTAGFIDVFMNGVKLAAADYTATNGSDVVLASGAATGDIIETVAYSAFTVADQDFTGETTAEDLTVTGAFTSQGIDDNATSTAMTLDSSGNLLVGTTDTSPHNNSGTTSGGIALHSDAYLSVGRANGAAMFINRQQNDGDIIEFRKDGSTVGSIGSAAGARLFIGDGDTGLRFAGDLDTIVPWNTNNTLRDAAIDLGESTGRFKDLYLSGGVYLGGTGSANKLDDYEEGTWTPVVGNVYGNVPSGTPSVSGYYTKVGRIVTCDFTINYSDSGAAVDVDDRLSISGLPFDGELFVGGTGQAFQYGAISGGNNAIWTVVTSTSDDWYLYCIHEDGSVQYDEVIRGSFTYRTS